MPTLNLGKMADDLQDLIDDLENRDYEGETGAERDRIVEMLEEIQTQLRSVCNDVVDLSDDYQLVPPSVNHNFHWTPAS